MENQNKTTAKVIENGPLVIMGSIEITHADGTVETKETRCSICRCAASKNKPYCDGSHREAGFVG